MDENRDNKRQIVYTTSIWKGSADPLLIEGLRADEGKKKLYSCIGENVYRLVIIVSVLFLYIKQYHFSNSPDNKYRYTRVTHCSYTSEIELAVCYQNICKISHKE